MARALAAYHLLATGIAPAPGGRLQLWPSPADSLLMLQTDLSEGQSQIIDLLGREILRQPYTQGQGVQVSRLPAGPYVLVLSDKNGKPHARKPFLKN